MSQNEEEFSIQQESIRQVLSECRQKIADLQTLIIEMKKQSVKKHTENNKTRIDEPPEILDHDLEIGDVKPDGIKRIERQPFYNLTDHMLRSSNVFH